MSAHIPEYRRAINGRTWAQEWRPEAIEHHQAASSVVRQIALYALALGAGVGGFLYFVKHIGG